MFKRFFFLVFLFSSLKAFGQNADSLFVIPYRNGWVISQKLENNETSLSLSRRFHVPPAMVADLNRVSYQQELLSGTMVLIPLGVYNFKTEKPEFSQEVRPLFYRAGNEKSFLKIAKYSGVSLNTLQQWNQTQQTEARSRQVLLVGWVLYDKTIIRKESVVAKESNPETKRSGIKVVEQMQNPVSSNPDVSSRNESLIYPDRDSLSGPEDTLAEVSEGERVFLEQTNGGLYETEEKGTAAFFKRAGTSANGIYFAFHNTAPKGTIIKVYNPGTGKTVYAKVIGTLPVREVFHNAIIGISSDARAALEARGEKLWCELKYAP